MSGKISRLSFILLVVTLLFTLIFFDVCCARSPKDEPMQSEFELRQISENTLKVTMQVFLAGRYEVFDLNIRDEVTADITTSLAEAPETPYVMSITIPFTLTEVTNLPRGANYTYGFWGDPPRGTLKIHLPAKTSYSSIRLKGHLLGSSVFWKNTAEISFLSVTLTGITYTPSYTVITTLPSASMLGAISPNVLYQEASMEGKKAIIVSPKGLFPRGSFAILYELEARRIYGPMAMLIIIFMILAIPYLVPTSAAESRESPLPERVIPIRRLYNEILKLDASKLLAIFISCALLMMSLSFVAGPDPRPKVYIMATEETARTVSDFVQRQARAVAITIYDEMNEFKTLTDLGVISSVIVGDFLPPTYMANKYIYPALDTAPHIIILEPYAFDAFSSEIQRRYPDKTVVVEDLGALERIISPRRGNVLGLRVSQALYRGVAAFVGICSLILVFLGMAFLSCKLIEVGKKPGVAGFPEAITYAVFTFVFTQTIYVICSVLLAVPLGLHTSSPRVTAIGFMGFGGGSRPRMFAGMVGFLFGSLISLKGVLKLSRASFISLIVAVFFVLLDPLTGGLIFHEFVLLFTVGPKMGAPDQFWSLIHEALDHIGVHFGAWASPTYGISTGIMLYYAGVILFCLITKVKKSTAMALLIISAFIVSLGALRVADMAPWKTIASVIPGIVTGFFLAAIFCLINLVETIIRKKTGADTMRV